VLADGDRRKLIESFACIAHHLMGRYRHWSLDEEDVFQVAMVAIIEAIDSFDPSKGVPLGAHVTMRVKFELSDELRRTGRQARYSNPLPREIADQADAGPDLDAEHEELWDEIDKLPFRDQSILISAFGLDGQAPRTRTILALELGRPRRDVGNSTIRSISTLRTALSA
jgi:RNA polymerase sigma factor (sigma-70 family)